MPVYDIEMTTGRFWAKTAERAIKTAAQALVAALGTNVTGVTDLDWAQTGWIVLTATLLSVLTSLASDRIGTPGPSLVSDKVIGKVDVVQPPVEVAVPAAETETPAAVGAPAKGSMFGTVLTDPSEVLAIPTPDEKSAQTLPVIA